MKFSKKVLFMQEGGPMPAEQGAPMPAEAGAPAHPSWGCFSKSRSSQP